MALGQYHNLKRCTGMNILLECAADAARSNSDDRRIFDAGKHVADAAAAADLSERRVRHARDQRSHGWINVACNGNPFVSRMKHGDQIA